jgi:D-alanyl-D-alanine carboxypeptidase
MSEVFVSRTNSRVIVWLAVWLASASGLAADDPDLGRFVEAIGTQAVEGDRAVGLSIAVARGDDLLFAKGFGLANVELQVPARAETVYRIGSITKEFTAAAILILVEDGKVALDDSLTRLLPDYPKQGESITIRHLLQHTSGLTDFTRLATYRRERTQIASQEQVLERFQDLPLEFRPGEKHRYCNSGYFLLGLIVERASGQSFREFVEERLIRRLGMQAVYCDDSWRIIPHRASGYTRWGGALRNAPLVDLNQTLGAGNLAATVTDMIIWQRALAEHRLLSAESSRLMMTPGTLNSGKSFNYGLGIRIIRRNGHRGVRHAGAISGFWADLVYYPDFKIAIAVAANADSTNAGEISDRVADYLLKQ